MSTILVFLSLVALLAFLLGIIKPGLVVRWVDEPGRGAVFLYYGLSSFVLLMLASALAPPVFSLKVESPSDNAIVTAESVVLKGNTGISAQVLVNDQSVTPDSSNAFETSIPLQMGSNKISVKATADGESQLSEITIIRTTEQELARLEAEKAEKERLARIVGKPDQYEFHTRLKEFESRYDKASNEMKKSKVARELKTFLTTYLGNRKFKDWRGTFTRVGTEEGGDKAYIVISSRHDRKSVSYQTWNNSLSDLAANSMLVLNSKVYKQVEELEEGDPVTFSGSFLRDSDRGVEEQSFSEAGWVTDPEFTIIFTDIQKTKVR